jgi:SPP1 gp7 family putative phage head morphogenesis protein
MTTPNAELLDDWIDRSVDVFAMVDTEVGILARDIEEEEDQRTLAELIALYLAAMDPMLRPRALDRILAQRADALRQVRDRLYRMIERFTEDEGRFVSETVGPVQDETKNNYLFSAAFIAVLFNKVLQRPISGWEQKIDDLFKDMIERDRERIEKTFSRAYGGGRGAAWLTAALRKDFALNTQTAHIILHAAVQHSRSVIVDFAAATVGAKVRWVSVLDSKTTAICRSRSGKIYPADSGPRPPAHARCRSIVVPYFEGKGDAEEPTYSGWLKKQTPERVRQILGKAKGAMFLRGELSLEDMVTAKGRELTLKEFQAKR